MNFKSRLGALSSKLSPTGIRKKRPQERFIGVFGKCPVGPQTVSEEAAEHLKQQIPAVDERAVFPAFRGPNFDETPDQDHGNNIMRSDLIGAVKG